MKNFRWIAIAIAVSVVLACSLPFTPTPAASPTTASTLTGIPATNTPPEPTITPAAPLTAEMIRNATYHLPQLGQTVTLSDGEYHGGTEAEPVHAWLEDPILFGDLDGDSAEDAAVLLTENGGGTGVFVSIVVMLNHNGHPIQSHAAFIDDRPLINSFTLSDGRIVLDADLHSLDDPMCCPTFPMTGTWRWTANRLVLVRFSSRTPSNEERAIDIDSPSEGAAVSGSAHVQGSVTIAPFENTLVCRVYDASGTKLTESPIMVDAEEMGAPGTFDVTIDLAGIPSGTSIHLEILDLSMQDGSMLAMDSVELQFSG
jgi:hypothetical protein